MATLITESSATLDSKAGWYGTRRRYLQALIILLFIILCSCTGCGGKGQTIYKDNGITVDFKDQPYVIANVRGTIVSVERQDEVARVNIRLQMLELMQKTGEEKPGLDYRDKKIMLEMHRPPEGMEQGRTLDARVRIVHAAKGIKFLSISAKVS